MFKFLFLGFISGGLIALQAITNGVFNAKMHSIFWSAAVMFGIGFVVLLTLALVMEPFHPVREAIKAAPWWSLIGGIVVGTYLLVVTYIAPIIGVPLALLAVICGQVFFAMVFEQFGFLGVSQHVFDVKKAVGLLMLGCGVYLIKA